MDQTPNDDDRREKNKKQEQLEQFRRKKTDGYMTDANGFRISDDERTLRACKRGPTIFQDFQFYKKQHHFSRERIPEKVVHARSFGCMVISKHIHHYKSLIHYGTCFIQSK